VPGLLLLVRKSDRAGAQLSAAEAELVAEVVPLVAVK